MPRIRPGRVTAQQPESRWKRFKRIHEGVGKVMRPVCWVAKRVAPIAGGILGSALPGVGTAAGAAAGGAVASAAAMGEKLWQK